MFRLSEKVASKTLTCSLHFGKCSDSDGVMQPCSGPCVLSLSAGRSTFHGAEYVMDCDGISLPSKCLGSQEIQVIGAPLLILDPCPKM